MDKTGLVDELSEKLKKWNPDEIVPEFQNIIDHMNIPVVGGKIGKYVIVNDIKCLNVCTHNYLCLNGSGRMEKNAIEAVRNYGVGACGPRAFFGTMDAHLKLEEDTAKFFGLEEAICYSYGFCTISSAITAYCKKSDVAFCDENANLSSRNGFETSRCKIIYFKHNDPQDYERVLNEYDSKITQKQKKTERRFLFIEGIYAVTGKICKLPKLVRISKKYRVRIFLDETNSVGVLGSRGRGVTEHFNINKNDIDVIIGSYETAMGSIGGFCVGSSYVIDHQRLFASSYCFSAALPPLLAVASSVALAILDSTPKLLLKLKYNCIRLHEYLSNSRHFSIISDPESPIKFIVPLNSTTIPKIISKCYKNGVAISQNRYVLPSDRNYEKQSKTIRLILNVCLSDEDLQKISDTILKAFTECE